MHITLLLLRLLLMLLFLVLSSLFWCFPFFLFFGNSERFKDRRIEDSIDGIVDGSLVCVW
jgi:hypothetical protein